MVGEHDDCLKVPEFERFAEQTAIAARVQADYQRVQNGSIQAIREDTGKIFDKLDAIGDRVNDTYKTITEINAQTLLTVERVAQKRDGDLREQNRRFDDMNERFDGIEANIDGLANDTKVYRFFKEMGWKAWAKLVAATTTVGGIATAIYFIVHMIK
jgi:hypothetical protein